MMRCEPGLFLLFPRDGDPHMFTADPMLSLGRGRRLGVRGCTAGGAAVPLGGSGACDLQALNPAASRVMVHTFPERPRGGRVDAKKTYLTVEVTTSHSPFLSAQ